MLIHCVITLIVMFLLSYLLFAYNKKYIFVWENVIKSIKNNIIWYV